MRRKKEATVVAPTSLGSARRVSQSQVRERLSRAWDEAVFSAFGLSQGAARQILTAMLASSEQRNRLAAPDGPRTLTAAVAVALGNLGTASMAKEWKGIKTEEQLRAAETKVRRAGQEIPTASRKAIRDLLRALPRRGGPGRTRALTEQQSALVCDQILALIRQKLTVKVALQKVSEMSVTLFGKRIGTRTLQKAWNNRDKLQVN